jgi:putative Mn2+ efflux pump MntP
MSLFELLLIGIGLSMDAFAVAICRGLSMPHMSWKHAVVIAAYFGGFQAAMPLFGWLLGSTFAGYVQSVDHWIAFVLLGLIGGNMIREALHDDECDGCGEQEGRLKHRQLLLLAIATSVDALAVGVTFAFLKVQIYFAISVIGITTFLLSLVGVAVGFFLGARLKKRAEISGGVILILLGVKILVEHLLG